MTFRARFLMLLFRDGEPRLLFYVRLLLHTR